jgi:DNA replication and repair protein RecF
LSRRADADVTTPLRFASVSIRALRNLARVDLEPAPRLTVVSGDNGQGKTSILEAFYLVATTRSFRTSRLRELVSHGAEAGSVKARLEDGVLSREQVVGIEGGARRVLLDGKRPASFAAYAVKSPVVVFHPGETTLSSGPASGRRTLLDRIALFVDPTSMDHHARYAEASRARQRVLETRGVEASDLDAFERLMGVHGAALTRARREAASRLVDHVTDAFARITREQRAIELSYEPGGPDDPGALEQALRATRDRDRHRGSASSGPHRDELAIAIGGFGARADASQGEHRAITLALKLAELACIAAARGVYPVLLLDDVSSELDAERTAAFFDVLFETPGQIVLTTTRPDLIRTPGLAPGDRADCTVVAGAIRT